MENNKKILVPTIIAVVTLILLVFGATYAYFTVGTTNNFGTKELNANIQDMAASVVLEQVESTLSLDVTRAMMSEDNAGTTYYASGSSTPANIAKMSVAGEGRYACDYTLSVTKSASSSENDLYEAIQGMSQMYGNASLILNGTHYDFYTSYLFPLTYSGTMYNITKDTPQYITANISIRNANSNQNALKGKDITLTIAVTEFDCYLQEVDDSAPIYAIYDESAYTLAFYQNNDEVNVGDTYDEYTVTEVYKNLNNTNYTSKEDVPWKDVNLWYHEDDTCGSIVFEDAIRPKSTAYWFSIGPEYEWIDFNGFNLDTSQVTNMSHMFDSAIDFRGMNLSTWDTSNVTNMSYMFSGMSSDSSYSLDLENWDVSNVTDMSYMFSYSGQHGAYISLSNWDTSNVTNMEGMFASAGWSGGLSVDLSNWDTSNVTNMSHMFDSALIYDVSDLGNITRREVTVNEKTYIAWDTSKVTNMSYMFNWFAPDGDYELDLTSWQVPLVTNHNNFNEGVESKITPPIWVN